MHVSDPMFGLQNGSDGLPGYAHASPSLPFGSKAGGPATAPHACPDGAWFTVSEYGPALAAFEP
jgi:hypothetical protein